jgi:hypothetical protein
LRAHHTPTVFWVFSEPESVGTLAAKRSTSIGVHPLGVLSDSIHVRRSRRCAHPP